MFKKLLATIEISRPHNMTAAAACVFAGYYLAGGGYWRGALGPATAAGLVAGCGNLINDYYDTDIDMINKPGRPLPSKRLGASYVLKLYILCTALITLIGFLLLDLKLWVFAVAWEMGLFIYAHSAKRLPLAGNLIVATVASSAFFLGAFAAGNVAAAWFPFSFAFLFIMGREQVKGAEDLEGDEVSGARTLAVIFGREKSSLLAAVFLLCCSVIAPLPAVAGFYGSVYFFMMELAVVPGLIVTSYMILNYQDKRMLNIASWILKGEMFLGIIAMGFSGNSL